MGYYVLSSKKPDFLGNPNRYLVSNFLATLSLKLTSSFSNLWLRWKIELFIKKRVHFYLGSQHLPEEEIHGTAIKQKWWKICWFMYILSNKDMLHKAPTTFLWKYRRSCSQLLCRKFVLLKIIKHFQKNIDGGVWLNFLVCCYSGNWRFASKNIP